MSSLTRGADIKRETTTVYAPELISLLEERREDPHGSETYGSKGGNSGKARSHINTKGI